MPNKNFTPVQFKGVMISSTFTDLKLHRKELIEALQKEKLFPIVMEAYVPDQKDDVISSSLDMVHEASAYIGLISRRYGEVIECPTRNPNSFSVSRLEFEEAQDLELPTLIFIMGEDHPVKEAEIEIAPEKREKLEAYRNRAKEKRVYVNFDSLEDFKVKAAHAVAKLGHYLREQDALSTQIPEDTDATVLARPHFETTPIPTPPTFYAEPRYIGTHNFLGRKAELDTLTEWAMRADPHPILLFEAIGGTGKSMLTWEWTTIYATEIRKDWAGIFWYSFYEKGAIMTDFCQRALAYITSQPLEEFRKKKIAELSQPLLRHLQNRPWLLILDGLERVLVAYHRFDAAQVADDQVDASEDQIAKRDPCAAIRPEDDDLLRMFAAAAPSKILITTRLTPRILLSPANQGIQGILRVPLPGLRPADAERLLRSCGVTGTSKDIQNYLKSHCDCHPLVTGVLAGLINDYLPDRGNFDAWAADSAGGGQLNLANLDLVQKRNHILLTALAALPEKSRQLLSTLALISESVEFATLSAINPHLPPEPEEVEEPENPENRYWWETVSQNEKDRKMENYRDNLQEWEEYEQAVKSRQQQLPFATQELTGTVRDLERRGLLQYDPLSKRYDLHPVVRGISSGRLGQEDKERYGKRVVDHFSRRAHTPYDEAETLNDIRYGLQVVRAFLQMGYYQQACDAYKQISGSLLINLEAHSEVLSIARPFFLQGWDILPDKVDEISAVYLANEAAFALDFMGEYEAALACYGLAIKKNLEWEDLGEVGATLLDVTNVLDGMKRLAKAQRLTLLALDIASLQDAAENLFRTRLFRFAELSKFGLFNEAGLMWDLLDPMGRKWPRNIYRPGGAEVVHAWFRLYQGTLQEDLLIHAEQLALTGKNRPTIRSLHNLRGEWQLERGNWELAAESFSEAVRMAREIGKIDTVAEAKLCLTKLHLGQLATPQEEIEQLEKANEPHYQTLAESWLAIGNYEQAKKHALAAYKRAWADGEPYVYRYALNKAHALLKQLGAEIPDLPPYDPDNDEKLPWEDQVAAAIEKLRAEKLAEKNSEDIKE